MYPNFVVIRMSSVHYAVVKALDKCDKNAWPCIYWAIDLHGTLIPSSRKKGEEVLELYPDAELVLRQITQVRKDKIILFTATNFKQTDKIVDWLLKTYNIPIAAVNKNPMVPDAEYTDFSKKFYFDILLDDKAGFEPDKDWTIILDTLYLHNSI